MALEKLPIPKRCENELCRDIIKNTKTCSISKIGNVKRFYCDSWCMEQANPPEIIHVCKYCPNATNVVMRANGMSAGFYKKVCDECWEGILLNRATKKIKAKKEPVMKFIDPIGRTCFSCKQYKGWDDFKNSHGNIQSNCMTCYKRKRKERYLVNIERERARGITYYQSKKNKTAHI